MRLIIFGPPGAGKGTQALFISKEFGISHISTGDIFRLNISNETALGLEAKRYIDAGELVPDSVTNAMIKDRLLQPDCSSGFLLDGYPRTPSQADALDALLTEMSTHLDAVINLIVPDEEIITRLFKRQRNDDSEMMVRKRLGIHHETTEPLARYYRARHLLIDIEGVGGIDDITRKIFDSVHERARS